MNLSINYLSSDKNDLIVNAHGSFSESGTSLYIKSTKDIVREVTLVINDDSYLVEVIESDEGNDLMKKTNFNVLKEDDEITNLDVSYLIKQDRDEQSLKINITNNTEVSIPKIDTEEAINIFDFVKEDEKLE